MFAARLQFYSVIVLPAAVLMALEIVSSRVLAPHFGNSVYVWGSIIGVFLAAMSLGYVWGGRLADRRPTLAALGRVLLGAALTQSLILLAGERIVAALGELTRGSPLGTLLATTLLFGPSTVCLATVAPYAVKLATRDLDIVGGTAGNLYALSTAASLVGTLGATFVLIPHLNLEQILRLLLTLTVLASVVALVSTWRRERLTMALAAGLLLLAAAPHGVGQTPGLAVLADRLTPYQALRVIESDGVRFMYSDGVAHGAVRVDDRETWLNYPRYAAAALLLHPDVSHLLALGMGSGSVGSYLQSRIPGLEVDYVEIDPAVPELARQLLFFADNERMTVHVDDGRRFLARRPEARWDYVYADTYIGQSIPFHLATVEFFTEVKHHLTPDGVFGLNLTGSLENPFALALLRSLRQVFAQTYVFAVPGGNYLLLAADTAVPVSREQMRERAAAIDQRASFAPLLTTIARQLHDLDLDLARARLLTDDYAPVNYLVRFDQSPERWRTPSSPPPPAAAFTPQEPGVSDAAANPQDPDEGE